MQTYDIGIGWASPYERTFAVMLKEAARRKKKSFREITFETLAEDYRQVQQEEIHFTTYLDRGSIDDMGFAVLAKTLAEEGARVINNPEAVVLHSSKGRLYPRLKSRGLPLPKTFIVSQTTQKKEYEAVAKELGVPFVIVSSYGAGDPADRLLLTGEDADDIIRFTKNNFADTFLVHEYVYPTLVKGQTAWFRPIYAAGVVLPLWWDPLNHFYEPFGKSREERVIEEKLKNHIMKIADITGFELFSSEFAMTEKGKLLIVDYANNPIDLDSSENIPGGLPEEVLERITMQLVV